MSSNRTMAITAVTIEIVTGDRKMRRDSRAGLGSVEEDMADVAEIGIASVVTDDISPAEAASDDVDDVAAML